MEATLERERLVVTLYHFDYKELTLRKIGEVLGVTKSRASQLHTKGVLHLKAPLGRGPRASRPEPSRQPDGHVVRAI